MSPRFVLKAVLLPLLILVARAAPTASSEEKGTLLSDPYTVTWKLENPAQIGGRATEMLGSPKVLNEGGVKAVAFNGVSDGLFVPVNPVCNWPQFTIEVLFKPESGGEEEQRFIHIQDKDGRRIMIETRLTKDGRWALDTYLFSSKDNNRALLDKTLLHATGQWYWVALVYDGKTMTNYINGVKELSGEVVLPPMAEGRISIGVRQNKVCWYKGAIREIQFHSVALPPDALRRVDAK